MARQCGRPRQRRSPSSLGALSRLVDRAVNRAAHPGALPASERAIEIHQAGPVVDLLVGSVLFRNSFVRGSRGLVDLPRLQAAGVNVIGLTIATRFPDVRGTLSNMHFRSMGAPESAFKSDMAIAEWLIARIDRWCHRSRGALSLIRTHVDLETVLHHKGRVGVLIVAQGGHILDGNLANVARLRELGVRVLAPAHVMDNALVGSGTGRRASGLTGLGREVIAELEAQAMVVDLAHMSAAGIHAALPLLRRPFLLSHTGIREVAGDRSAWRRYSAATRNVPAEVAAEVGRRGGLVGVALGTQLVGGTELDDVVKTVRAAMAAAGAENVAIGSDMDGALRTVIDVAGLPALTDALLDDGLDQSLVAGVVGRNAIRFLRSVLGPAGQSRS